MFNVSFQNSSRVLAATLSFAVLPLGCARQQTETASTGSSQPASTETAEPPVELKKMPAGKEFSGFLKDYSNLKPNPNLDGMAQTFVSNDARRRTCTVTLP